MNKPKVRLAENSDGQCIREILEEKGPVEETLDFGNINPFWLVAEMEGRGIVGAVQTCPSRPVGQLEMLCVTKSVTDAERGLICRELLISGSAVLYGYGATHIRGFVPFAEKGYKRVLKKRGAVVLEQGNVVMRRIR